MDQIVGTRTSDRSPVVDGLNCAALTRDQFERTLAGRVNAINLTSLRPGEDLHASMSEMARALSIVAANSGLGLAAAALSACAFW